MADFSESLLRAVSHLPVTLNADSFCFIGDTGDHYSPCPAASQVFPSATELASVTELCADTLSVVNDVCSIATSQEDCLVRTCFVGTRMFCGLTWHDAVLAGLTEETRVRLLYAEQEVPRGRCLRAIVPVLER